MKKTVVDLSEAHPQEHGLLRTSGAGLDIDLTLCTRWFDGKKTLVDLSGAHPQEPGGPEWGPSSGPCAHL